MELCRADRLRLVRKGYAEDDFCSRGADGIYRLRNVDGRCYFFDPSSMRCREYAARPLGCSIYPVNMTEDGEVIIDALCPEGATISKEELEEKGRRLRRLLITIDSEASKPH